MRYPRRFDIGDESGTYLTRWTLVSVRGWKLRVHLFRRPDRDACHHDHPWRFWTLVLWGGYVEDTPDGPNALRPGALAYRPAEYRHSVRELPRGRAVTLVLTAPEEREWGFQTRHGWLEWWRFVNVPFRKRVPWCEDGETYHDPVDDPTTP